MVLVGRELWRSSVPTLLLKHSHLEQDAEDHVHMILKEVDSTTSVGNLCQSSVTLTVKCFLMFKQNLLFFSSCPLLLVLSLSTTKDSLAPPSLPHFRYLCILIWSPLSLSSYVWCSHPSIIFIALHWTLSSRSMSVLYWRA